MLLRDGVNDPNAFFKGAALQKRFNNIGMEALPGAQLEPVLNGHQHPATLANGTLKPSKNYTPENSK